MKRFSLGIFAIILCGFVSAANAVTQNENPKQLTVYIRSSQPAANASHSTGDVYQTGRSRGGNPVQKIKVLDGKSAYVSADQSFPVVGYAYSASDIPGIRYEQLSSGYVVTPHLVNDSVELKIKGQKQNFNSLDNSKIDTAMLETTVKIPVGEWVSVSQLLTADHMDESDDNTVYSTRTTTTPTIDIDVKVLVDN
jgi:hypothetical protein